MGYFFDAETGGPVRLELRSIDGHDFQVLRRIGYHCDESDRTFEAPADLVQFRTDMASVPSVFTWLVPRSGNFLPAAVLHDALTGDPTTAPDGATIPPYLGPTVDRVEADRIFRVAMGELGTGHVRKWLMWAAVTLPTLWVQPTRRWWHRTTVAATIGITCVLGILSTLNLVGVIDVVPWMGDRPLWQQFVGGAIFAFLIPGALALTWGRLRLAGMIVGWALAFLLHVTIGIALVYGLYLLVERIVSGPADKHGVRGRLRDRSR